MMRRLAAVGIAAAALVAGAGVTVGYGLSTGFEQLAFVASTICCLEDRNANECPRIADWSPLNGVHQNGHGLRRRRNVQSHLVEEPLQLEQRRKMRLEIDLACNRQEIRKAPAKEALRVDVEPAPESEVAALNPCIFTKRQVAAGRILEQVLEIVVFDPDRWGIFHLEVRLDRSDRFLRCTEVGAVSGCRQDGDRTVR